MHFHYDQTFGSYVSHYDNPETGSRRARWCKSVRADRSVDYADSSSSSALTTSSLLGSVSLCMDSVLK